MGENTLFTLMAVGLAFVGLSTCSYESEKAREQARPPAPVASALTDAEARRLVYGGVEVLTDHNQVEYSCRRNSDALICQ